MFNWTLFLIKKSTTKNEIKNPATKAHKDLSNGYNFPAFYKFFCFAKNVLAFS